MEFNLVKIMARQGVNNTIGSIRRTQVTAVLRLLAKARND